MMKNNYSIFLMFILFISVSGLSQPMNSYNFENGSLQDDADVSNQFIQTGSAATIETGRAGLANHALKLNGDILTSQNSQASTFDEYSVSLWIKTSTNDILKRSIIDMYGGSVGGEGPIGFKMYLENGDLKIDAQYVFYKWFYGNDYGLGNYLVTIGHSNIADGQWHHVVLRTETTLAGNNPATIYRLYVDGVFSDALTMQCNLNNTYGPNASSPAFHTIAANQQLQVGHDISNGFHPYNDYVDDIRFFDYLIDGTEIEALFKRDPRVVYVDKDAAGTNSGLDWANAYTDLQNALDNSVPGDSVWVAEGTYTPSVSDRNESFIPAEDNIHIYGGFNGTETKLNQRDWKGYETILSGDLNGNDNTNLAYNEPTRSDNSYTVINLSNKSNIHIDGFTISGGHANVNGGTIFQRRGSAICAEEAVDIELKNNIIEKNVSDVEGAVRFYNSDNSISGEYTIESCVVQNNLSTYSSGLVFVTQGNGVAHDVNIYNSLFQNNTTKALTGSSSNANFSGSALTCMSNYLSDMNVNLVNNTFTRNNDFGTSSDPKSAVVLRRYGIWSNTSALGRLYANVYNNIFSDNFIAPGTPATRDVGLMNLTGNLLNELNMDNNRVTDASYLSSITASFSGSNVTTSPNFVDPLNGDFRLLASSGLIDQGNNSYLPSGITEDLNGDDRIENGTIDIGAFEYFVPAPDITNPTAVTKNFVVALDANGEETIDPTDVNDGSSDDMTSASNLDFTLDVSTFDCSDLGVNSVLLTVTDLAGNSDSESAQVTVIDNINPDVITQNITITLDANDQASITPGDIDNGTTDNCGVANLYLDVSSFDCSNIGPNTVTLFAEDNESNTGSNTAIVTVVENTVPSVSTQNISVSLDANGEVSIATTDIDNGSTDNCGISGMSLDVTDFTCADLGINTVTLTVEDGSGNTNTATAQVTVVDDIDPVANVNPLTTIALDANGEATLTGTDVDNGSTDNCSVASTSVDVTTFDCTHIGTTQTVNFTVTDDAGNTATTTADIQVVDNLLPTVITQPVTVTLDANGEGVISATDVDNGSTDNCGIASMSIDVTNFTCADIGTQTVTLTVEDNSGNTETGTAVVTVVETEAPVAITQDIMINLDANGQASISGSDVDNGSSDNCGVDALSLDISSFDCSNLGTNTVTLTVSDASGNTTTETAVVTVEDNIDPIAIGQDITTQLVGGQATIVPADVDNGSTDNCGIDNLAIDEDTFTATGVYPVVLTVTDASGNTATTTVEVTVEDNVGLEQEKINLTLAPNPTRNIVTITSSFNVDEIMIYDHFGRLVHIEKSSNIDLSSFANGVYTFRIHFADAQQVVTKKVVKH